MKATYPRSSEFVFDHEGEYSDDAGDPGGPTKWGITIKDARQHWKPDATPDDVKAMPKSVADGIYQKHYADPLHYDDLPAGVDLCVLDYGINSGIYRAAVTLQDIVMVPQDGIIGPVTLSAVFARDPETIIKTLYLRRLAFLQKLKTWPLFGNGWTRRCIDGQTLALSLAQQYPKGTYMPPAPLPTAVPSTFVLPPIIYQIIDAVLPDLEKAAVDYISFKSPFLGYLAKMAIDAQIKAMEASQRPLSQKENT